MKNCEHVDRINAYYDGELPPEERRLIEAHVEQCDVCTRELRQLRELSSLVSDVRLPVVPPEVIRRLHENAASVEQRVIVTLAESLTAAAAAILIACAAWIYVDRTKEEVVPTISRQWEMIAMAPGDEPAVSEQQQIARWIVEDLSMGNGHD